VDVKKYTALSVLHLLHVPPEVLATLQSFVARHGGTLLASQGSGTRNAVGEPTEPPELLTPPGEAPVYQEKACGAGRVVFLASPPRGFGRSSHRELLAELRPALDRVALPRELRHSGSEGLVPLLWGKSTRRWVHVLNYRETPGEMTVTLPECGGRTLTVHSPDATPPELTVLETGAGAVRFALKNVTTYAVVEIQ
jgi:hypothetical protein